MSVTEEMLGNQAAPRTLVHEGKAFTFRLLDQKAQAAFNRAVVARVRAAVMAAFADAPELLRAELKQLALDQASGYYDFLEEFVQGRPAVAAETRVVDGVPVEGRVTRREGGWLGTQLGMLTLAEVVCGCTHDEALRLIARRGEEFNHLMELTVRESFSGLDGGADDWAPLPPGEGAEGNVQAAPASARPRA